MGDYLRQVFDDHHLNRAAVAREYGVKPQTVNDMFSRATIGDEVLVALGKAAKLDLLAMMRQAKAASESKPPSAKNMVAEEQAPYGRPKTEMEGLKLTVKLEEYDEAVQLQILRFLQQLPKKAK